MIRIAISYTDEAADRADAQEIGAEILKLGMPGLDPADLKFYYAGG